MSLWSGGLGKDDIGARRDSGGPTSDCTTRVGFGRTWRYGARDMVVPVGMPFATSEPTARASRTALRIVPEQEVKPSVPPEVGSQEAARARMSCSRGAEKEMPPAAASCTRRRCAAQAGRRAWTARRLERAIMPGDCKPLECSRHSRKRSGIHMYNTASIAAFHTTHADAPSSVEPTGISPKVSKVGPSGSASSTSGKSDRAPVRESMFRYVGAPEHDREEGERME